MLALKTIEHIIIYMKNDIKHKIDIIDSELENTCYCFTNNDKLLKQRQELLEMLAQLNAISN